MWKPSSFTLRNPPKSVVINQLEAPASTRLGIRAPPTPMPPASALAMCPSCPTRYWTRIGPIPPRLESTKGGAFWTPVNKKVVGR